MAGRNTPRRSPRTLAAAALALLSRPPHCALPAIPGCRSVTARLTAPTARDAPRRARAARPAGHMDERQTGIPRACRCASARPRDTTPRSVNRPHSRGVPSRCLAVLLFFAGVTRLRGRPRKLRRAPLWSATHGRRAGARDELPAPAAAASPGGQE